MEKYRDLEHYHPTEVGKDQYNHGLVLKSETGEVIGGAEFHYKNDPFPYYYLELVWVLPEYQNTGEKFGSRILDTFNKFLHDKGKAGLLWNSIDADTPQYDMFERHGWQSAGRKGWYTYNLPKGAKEEQVSDAISSIAHSMAKQVRNSELEAA